MKGYRCWGYHCLQVGVLHTNYRELTRRNAGAAGVPLCGLSHMVNFLACAIHCHKAGCPFLLSVPSACSRCSSAHLCRMRLTVASAAKMGFLLFQACMHICTHFKH